MLGSWPIIMSLLVNAQIAHKPALSHVILFVLLKMQNQYRYNHKLITRLVSDQGRRKESLQNEPYSLALFLATIDETSKAQSILILIKECQLNHIYMSSIFLKTVILPLSLHSSPRTTTTTTGRHLSTSSRCDHQDAVSLSKGLCVLTKQAPLMPICLLG